MCQRSVNLTKARPHVAQQYKLTVSRCIPKKVTWNAADIIDTLSDARDHGFHWLEDHLPDWTAWTRDREKYVDRLNKAYEKTLQTTTLHGSTAV